MSNFPASSLAVFTLCVLLFAQLATLNGLPLQNQGKPSLISLIQYYQEKELQNAQPSYSKNLLNNEETEQVSSDQAVEDQQAELLDRSRRYSIATHTSDLGRIKDLLAAIELQKILRGPQQNTHNSACLTQQLPLVQSFTDFQKALDSCRY